MRTLKGWILTGIILTAMAGSAAADPGIIYGFAAGDGTATTKTTDPCKVDSTTSKLDSGIIYGFTGIIYGFTGIIVTDFNSKDTVNCGIIVTDSK